MAGLGSILYKEAPQHFVLQSPKTEELAHIHLDKFLNAVFPSSKVFEDEQQQHHPHAAHNEPIVLLSNLDKVLSTRLGEKGQELGSWHTASANAAPHALSNFASTVATFLFSTPAPAASSPAGHVPPPAPGGPSSSADSSPSTITTAATATSTAAHSTISAFPEGRLGPERVCLDSADASRLPVTLDNDLLGFSSNSNFASMRANTCVCASRWMYEVTLKSQGIMQIGWASPSCVFNNEEGVGDSRDSFGYDGKRMRIWNVGSRRYGQNWVAGDVIGCCIDATLGTAEFYRNGVALGPITNLRTGLAYFPALSISIGERVRVNFGNWKFRYPVPGYSPLQLAPSSCPKAAYLTDALLRLSKLAAVLGDDGNGEAINGADSKAGSALSVVPGSADTVEFTLKLAEDEEEVYLRSALMKLPAYQQSLVRFMCAAHIIDRLSPLMENIYLFRAYVGPLFLYLFSAAESSEIAVTTATTMSTTSLSSSSKSFPLLQLRYILNMFAVCLNNSMLVRFMGGLLVPFIVEDSQAHIWPQQTTGLKLMRFILRDRRYIKAWLSHGEFTAQLEALFTDKGLSSDDLSIILPDVWWEGYPDTASDSPSTLVLPSPSFSSNSGASSAADEIRPSLQREKFQQRMKELENKMAEMDALRSELFSLFLNDTLPLASNVSGGTLRSPFEFVYVWLSRLGPSNTAWLRQFLPSGLTPRSCLANVAVACAAVLCPPGKDPERQARELWKEAIFVDDWFNSKLPVVGGDLTHVQTELKKKLDEEHSPPRPAKQVPSVEQSLVYNSALLYFLGALESIKGLRMISTELSTAKSAYKDAQKRLVRCDPQQEVAYNMLKRGLDLFLKDVELRVREDVLDRLVHLNPKRCITLQSWLRMLLEWLSAASQGDYFQFYPRHMIVDILELSDTLSLQPPLSPEYQAYFASSSTLSDLFTKIMFTLSALPGDARIRNPDLPQEILLGLTSLVSVAGNVRILETNKALSELFLRNVMHACDQNLWLFSVECLSRCVVGSGLAFNACRTILADLSAGTYDAQCFSQPLGDLFVAICKTDDPLVHSFMNRIFNAVSWSVTEFDQILQDIRQSPLENTENKSRYRRCLRIFDVIVTLLRLLETLAIKARFLFQGSTQSEVNITRLSEVTLLLLQRTTGDSLFDTVIGSHAVSLQSINRMCVLCPLLGVLEGLYAVKGACHEFVKKSFFENPSFTDEMLNYLVEYERELQGKENALNEREAQQLSAFLDLLQRDFAGFKTSRAAAETGGGEGSDDDENTCTICFAGKVTATFQPCGHRSCRLCITRHLLNNTKCFFCNAIVQNVVYSEPAPAVASTTCHDDTSVDMMSLNGSDLQASMESAGKEDEREGAMDSS